MIRNTGTLTEERAGNTLTFAVKGEIDHHTAKEIITKIDSELFVSRPDKLRLDLSGVEFMDSSGLGLILGRYRLATKLGVAFSVLEPSGAVLKLVKLSGCDRIINVEYKKKGDR